MASVSYNRPPVSIARTKFRELAPRVARLAIYVAVVTIAFGALWVRSTRARVDGALLSVGEPLTRSPRGGLARRGARRFVIGGEHVHVATGRSSQSRDAMLDAFAQRCTVGGAPLPAALAHLGEGAAPEGSVSAADGVLGAREGLHGYVACLEGIARLSSDALASRLQSYSMSGDVSTLGDFRYLYARTDGPATAWAAVWTDGPFRPSRLASPTDEGGRDLPGVPPPSRARRTLSVESEDGFDRFASYLVAGRPQATVLREHSAALAHAGFERLAATRTRPGADVVSYRRGARYLSAVYRRGASGDVSVVLFDAVP